MIKEMPEEVKQRLRKVISRMTTRKRHWNISSKTFEQGGGVVYAKDVTASWFKYLWFRIRRLLLPRKPLN